MRKLHKQSVQTLLLARERAAEYGDTQDWREWHTFTTKCIVEIDFSMGACADPSVNGLIWAWNMLGKITMRDNERASINIGGLIPHWTARVPLGEALAFAAENDIYGYAIFID